jgi:DnaA family protein
MAASPAQLALDLRPRDDATLENFCARPGNAAALAALTAGGDELVFLHGPAEGGKSHLLQAMCHAVTGPSLYLPAAQLRDYPAAEVLRGTEELALVCVDDLDALAGLAAWERGLFHLYNRSRNGGCRLLVAARLPPTALPLGLPDLRSRLAAGLVFALPAQDDADLAAILAFRARRRGLELPREVAAYILVRAGRSLGELLAILERLDAASLAAQRALTLPFVRQTLGW